MLIENKIGKKILIRVDFNVPIRNNQITDFTRIKAALPTIKHFLNAGAKVILISHLGRPKKREKKYSLKILVEPLAKLLNTNILFSEHIIKNDKNAINLENGEVLLLENLRFYEGEANNDKDFAQLLSKYGDIYINDAFGVSHRMHASTFGIHAFFKEEKYMGFLLERELIELHNLTKEYTPPFTVLIGGSKIGSKIHILTTFLNVADNILIGGGMAFPFIKHLGGEIGDSLCLDEELDVVKNFLNNAKKTKTNIVLPTDCLVTESLEKKTNVHNCKINKIPKKYMGVDIGPDTIIEFKKILQKSKSVMWNGPMGVAEIKMFANGTNYLAKYIVECTASGLYSLVGGGDTVSDISRLGLKKKFSYVSTGGGAMLSFFENNNLIGAKGLKKILKKHAT